MTLGDLDAFICQRDDGLEARTVSRIDSSLRSFFTYLVKDRIREDNIALLLDKPRLEDYLPHALSVDQVDSILDAIRAKGSDDLLFARDYTFFELIYSCGLRISEAIGLKISSYNAQEHSLIVFGKRSKERLVFVGEVASLALDDYLANVRPVLAAANRKKAARHMVFFSKLDSLMSFSLFLKLVIELAANVAIIPQHCKRTAENDGKYPLKAAAASGQSTHKTG